MSLLPESIIPQQVPLGSVNSAGKVIIEKNWWLLLYNLVLNSFGEGLSGDESLALSEGDIDALNVDAIVLRQKLASLQVQQLPDYVPSPSELPDIARALLCAQDVLLADPAAAAQPFLALTVGASPFAYTAAFNGHVAVTAGTVSAISLERQGASIATGLVTGLIPVSRNDQVTVTYSVTPTMTFVPT